jgi:hypothetical protein
LYTRGISPTPYRNLSYAQYFKNAPMGVTGTNIGYRTFSEDELRQMPPEERIPAIQREWNNQLRRQYTSYNGTPDDYASPPIPAPVISPAPAPSQPTQPVLPPPKRPSDEEETGHPGSLDPNDSRIFDSVAPLPNEHLIQPFRPSDTSGGASIPAPSMVSPAVDTPPSSTQPIPDSLVGSVSTPPDSTIPAPNIGSPPSPTSVGPTGDLGASPPLASTPPASSKPVPLGRFVYDADRTHPAYLKHLEDLRADPNAQTHDDMMHKEAEHMSIPVNLRGPDHQHIFQAIEDHFAQVRAGYKAPGSASPAPSMVSPTSTTDSTTSSPPKGPIYEEEEEEEPLDGPDPLVSSVPSTPPSVVPPLALGDLGDPLTASISKSRTIFPKAMDGVDRSSPAYTRQIEILRRAESLQDPHAVEEAQLRFYDEKVVPDPTEDNWNRYQAFIDHIAQLEYRRDHPTVPTASSVRPPDTGGSVRDQYAALRAQEDHYKTDEGLQELQAQNDDISSQADLLQSQAAQARIHGDHEEANRLAIDSQALRNRARIINSFRIEMQALHDREALDPSASPVFSPRFTQDDWDAEYRKAYDYAQGRLESPGIDVDAELAELTRNRDSYLGGKSRVGPARAQAYTDAIENYRQLALRDPGASPESGEDVDTMRGTRVYREALQAMRDDPEENTVEFLTRALAKMRKQLSRMLRDPTLAALVMSKRSSIQAVIDRLSELTGSPDAGVTSSVGPPLVQPTPPRGLEIEDADRTSPFYRRSLDELRANADLQNLDALRRVYRDMQRNFPRDNPEEFANALQALEDRIAEVNAGYNIQRLDAGGGGRTDVPGAFRNSVSYRGFLDIYRANPTVYTEEKLSELIHRLDMAHPAGSGARPVEDLNRLQAMIDARDELLEKEQAQANSSVTSSVPPIDDIFASGSGSVGPQTSPSTLVKPTVYEEEESDYSSSSSSPSSSRPPSRLSASPPTPSDEPEQEYPHNRGLYDPLPAPSPAPAPSPGPGDPGSGGPIPQVSPDPIDEPEQDRGLHDPFSADNYSAERRGMIPLHSQLQAHLDQMRLAHSLNGTLDEAHLPNSATSTPPPRPFWGGGGSPPGDGGDRGIYDRYIDDLQDRYFPGLGSRDPGVSRDESSDGPYFTGGSGVSVDAFPNDDSEDSAPPIRRRRTPLEWLRDRLRARQETGSDNDDYDGVGRDDNDDNDISRLSESSDDFSERFFPKDLRRIMRSSTATQPSVRNDLDSYIGSSPQPPDVQPAASAPPVYSGGADPIPSLASSPQPAQSPNPLPRVPFWELPGRWLRHRKIQRQEQAHLEGRFQQPPAVQPAPAPPSSPAPSRQVSAQPFSLEGDEPLDEVSEVDEERAPRRTLAHAWRDWNESRVPWRSPAQILRDRRIARNLQTENERREAEYRDRHRGMGYNPSDPIIDPDDPKNPTTFYAQGEDDLRDLSTSSQPSVAPGPPAPVITPPQSVITHPQVYINALERAQRYTDEELLRLVGEGEALIHAGVGRGDNMQEQLYTTLAYQDVLRDRGVPRNTGVRNAPPSTSSRPPMQVQPDDASEAPASRPPDAPAAPARDERVSLFESLEAPIRRIMLRNGELPRTTADLENRLQEAYHYAFRNVFPEAPLWAEPRTFQLNTRQTMGDREPFIIDDTPENRQRYDTLHRLMGAAEDLGMRPVQPTRADNERVTSDYPLELDHNGRVPLAMLLNHRNATRHARLWAMGYRDDLSPKDAPHASQHNRATANLTHEEVDQMVDEYRNHTTDYRDMLRQLTNHGHEMTDFQLRRMASRIRDLFPNMMRNAADPLRLAYQHIAGVTPTAERTVLGGFFTRDTRIRRPTRSTTEVSDPSQTAADAATYRPGRGQYTDEDLAGLTDQQLAAMRMPGEDNEALRRGFLNAIARANLEQLLRYYQQVERIWPTPDYEGEVSPEHEALIEGWGGRRPYDTITARFRTALQRRMIELDEAGLIPHRDAPPVPLDDRVTRIREIYNELRDLHRENPRNPRIQDLLAQKATLEEDLVNELGDGALTRAKSPDYNPVDELAHREPAEELPQHLGLIWKDPANTIHFRRLDRYQRILDGDPTLSPPYHSGEREELQTRLHDALTEGVSLGDLRMFRRLLFATPAEYQHTLRAHNAPFKDFKQMFNPSVAMEGSFLDRDHRLRMLGELNKRNTTFTMRRHFLNAVPADEQAGILDQKRRDLAAAEDRLAILNQGDIFGGTLSAQELREQSWLENQIDELRSNLGQYRPQYHKDNSTTRWGLLDNAPKEFSAGNADEYFTISPQRRAFPLSSKDEPYDYRDRDPYASELLNSLEEGAGVQVDRTRPNPLDHRERIYRLGQHQIARTGQLWNQAAHEVVGSPPDSMLYLPELTFKRPWDHIEKYSPEQLDRPGWAVHKRFNELLAAETGGTFLSPLDPKPPVVDEQYEREEQEREEEALRRQGGIPNYGENDPWHDLEDRTRRSDLGYSPAHKWTHGASPDPLEDLAPVPVPAPPRDEGRSAVSPADLSEFDVDDGTRGPVRPPASPPPVAAPEPALGKSVGSLGGSFTISRPSSPPAPVGSRVVPGIENRTIPMGDRRTALEVRNGRVQGLPANYRAYPTYGDDQNFYQEYFRRGMSLDDAIEDARLDELDLGQAKVRMQALIDAFQVIHNPID